MHIGFFIELLFNGWLYDMLKLRSGNVSYSLGIVGEKYAVRILFIERIIFIFHSLSFLLSILIQFVFI